jgi:hypothetical protein
MELKTRKAANSKKKTLAPEAIESDDAQPTQPFPTHEEIKYRAYEIYLSRGATDGHDLEDWLQAERDLSQASAGTTSAPV